MGLMTAEEKAPLYAEIPKSLKDRFARLAKKRSRKLTAELILCMERYLDEQEAKDATEEEDDD